MNWPQEAMAILFTKSVCRSHRRMHAHDLTLAHTHILVRSHLHQLPLPSTHLSIPFSIFLSLSLSLSDAPTWNNFSFSLTPTPSRASSPGSIFIFEVSLYVSLFLSVSFFLCLSVCQSLSLSLWMSFSVFTYLQLFPSLFLWISPMKSSLSSNSTLFLFPIVFLFNFVSSCNQFVFLTLISKSEWNGASVLVRVLVCRCLCVCECVWVCVCLGVCAFVNVMQARSRLLKKPMKTEGNFFKGKKWPCATPTPS